MDYSRTIDNFAAVLNFNRLFLKLNRLSVTNCWFSPTIGTKVMHMNWAVSELASGSVPRMFLHWHKLHRHNELESLNDKKNWA